MPEPTEKGSFSAEISQDVIDEALKSVEKSAASAPEGEDPQPSEPSTEAAPAAPGPDVAKELEGLKAQLELSMAKGREMMEKVRDSHEKMLRAMADLENYKKRAQKEKEEVQRYGIERLLKDLLPVIDNLDRALEHAKAGPELEAFRQGVAMTRKMFEDALAKHGVKAFSSRGQPFDPRLHEAMQQVETEEMPPNHVYAELVRGYMLHDRLARPALVMVSKAKAKEAAPASGGTAPVGSAVGAPGEGAQSQAPAAGEPRQEPES